MSALITLTTWSTLIPVFLRDGAWRRYRCPNDTKINDTSLEIAFHPPIYLINNAVFLVKCHRTFGQPWTELCHGVKGSYFFSFFHHRRVERSTKGMKGGNGIWMGNFTVSCLVVSVILGKIESLVFDIWILLIFGMCGKVVKLENLSYFEKIIIKMLILSGKKFGIKGWEISRFPDFIPESVLFQ